MQFAKLVIAILLVSAMYATARADTPMLYSRTTVIVRMEKPVDAAKPSAAFDTEMRDANSVIRTPGWFNFAVMGNFKGAMMVYPEPTILTVTSSSDYAPIDILMLNEYGMIVQILPSLIPAELTEPVISPPVLAALYIKGGTCRMLGINPGDYVQHTMFKKKPEVLTAPAEKTENPKAETPSAPPPENLIDAILKRHGEK